MDSSMLKALKAHIDYAMRKNESTVQNVIIGLRQQLDKDMESLGAQHHDGIQIL